MIVRATLDYGSATEIEIDAEGIRVQQQGKNEVFLLAEELLDILALAEVAGLEVTQQGQKRSAGWTTS